MCHSYSDLNFGVTFLEHGVYKKQKKTKIKSAHQKTDSSSW